MNIKKLAAVLAASVIAGAAATVTAFAESKGVKISEKNFPDKIFRQYVSENFDTDGNGYLSKEERKAVTKINVGHSWEDYDFNNKAKSLKGVEFFTALKSLSCDDCSLTSLDISKNIKLIYLSCSGNMLTDLDVSQNTELEYLCCHFNSLSELDINRNTQLIKLECVCNKLTSLDISKNTKLKHINCMSN